MNMTNQTMTDQTLTLDTLTCRDLHESIRTAKRGVMGDFSCGWQILAIDKDGERVTSDGDAVAYQNGKEQPTLRLLRELAAQYTNPAHTPVAPRHILNNAVALIVEGMGMTYADWGNAAERREHAEPTGDWGQGASSLLNPAT